MNFNISLKKLICFLLAVLMLLGTVACKDTGKKKKVIKKVKKKVIVVQEDDNKQDKDDVVVEEEEEEDEYVRPKRKLPEVDNKNEYYVEPIVPEFEYEYKELNITSDYVIVYSFEKWENRFESRNEDKSERAITETAFNRIAANDLKVFINEKYGFELAVVKDTTAEAQNAAKKIVIGDCSALGYKSNLAENEFAVKVVGQDIVFEGGHFTMVEKAVDWFQTVEIQAGKVATLTGKQDDFASTKKVNVVQADGSVKEVVYDYVWGDEFDGKEFMDDDKWAQGTFGLERQNDMLNIFNDPQFQYVENGKLRLTGDRYYDEGNALIGYATSGQIDTDGMMLFRNGYYEFRARLPYTRGGFPAIWTMTADAVGQENVPNYNYDDGYGIYSKRVWDLEFDLFESFADSDHMTTTIHKWYTPRRNTEFKKDPIDLTYEEEMMVYKDRENQKGRDLEGNRIPDEEKYNWVYDAPSGSTLKTENVNGTAVNVLFYHNPKAKDGKAYVNQNQIDTMLKKVEIIDKVAEGIPLADDEVLEELTPDELIWKEKYDNNELMQAHMRYVITMHVYNGTGDRKLDSSYHAVDTFKYRLSPFTNMGNSMCTYAYQFSYYGNKGDAQSGLSGSNRRKDDDGVYGDWRWYFDPETINNEYHIYALHVTPTHCTVYMDDVPFLDFDWDPAYDYKDLDGDGKGDDISNNNNGVGFNFWQYFLIDMMIYTPNNFKIDDVRKLQAGDVPLHLYIDYVRCYQNLADDSQAIYYPNGVA